MKIKVTVEVEFIISGDKIPENANQLNELYIKGEVQTGRIRAIAKDENEYILEDLSNSITNLVIKKS